MLATGHQHAVSMHNSESTHGLSTMTNFTFEVGRNKHGVTNAPKHSKFYHPKVQTGIDGAPCLDGNLASHDHGCLGRTTMWPCLAFPDAGFQA
jgi:hypothetical protein